MAALIALIITIAMAVVIFAIAMREGKRRSSQQNAEIHFRNELFSERPEGTFDAVLMDVQMPVMDGYEATRAIRALDHGEYYPSASAAASCSAAASAFAASCAAS